MNPTLYNWFFVNFVDNHVDNPETFKGSLYIIGQVQNDPRGRENGRWVRTSKIQSFNSDSVQTSHTLYNLVQPATSEVISKVYSGEYGGDRGEDYDG